MTFSVDGTLLATCSESTPTAVWIWSLKRLIPVAILIHHSSVKNLQWHPIEADLLMIHCTTNDSAVHFWKLAWDIPRVIKCHLEKSGGRTEVHWVYSKRGESRRFMYANAQNYVLRHTDGEDEAQSDIPSLGPPTASINGGPEDMFDEGNSMDLSPIKINQHFYATNLQDDFTEGGTEGVSEIVDDTFDYRKRLPMPP